MLSIALVVACSSDDAAKAAPAGGDGGPTGDSGAPAVRQRPEGPAADLSEEITGANAPFIGAASGLGVPDGYDQVEYVAAGTATDYEAVGDLGSDGRWTFKPKTSADYRTRVLVLRPKDVASASGTVIVEWLNVSGGVDANPDYASFQEEVLRKGHVWVGVSAQLIGVEGGPVLVKAPGVDQYVGKGLKVLDPERYGSLSHPGDGYSFDIYTQVARALLAGGAALGGVEPTALLAAGESQSAIALSTYYDGVQPLTQMFDGFFVHSRAGVSLPLVEPGKYADLAGAIGSTVKPVFRDDLAAPVMELQAESDVTGVLSSFAVRQTDSELFRLWEVAGTAHADAHLLGDIAAQIDCGAPVNAGPMHVVAKAALRGLELWVREGKMPTPASRLELTDGTTPEVQRDADGIALGGVRTPPVDVPAEVLSGVAGPNPDLLCILLGSTKPLSAARLAELYPSRADYQAKYDAGVDAAISAGFVLEDDRAAMAGFARPELIAP